MKKICDDNLCCGCSACQNACPQNCITMGLDKFGELHPVVDEAKCIKCGACKRVCQTHKLIDKKSPQKVLAGIIKNENQLVRASNGGIASELMLNFLRIGKVFASRLNEEFKCVCDEFQNSNVIDQYRGSKYVQSNLGNVFRQIKDYLSLGELCLFIGTPCQVAGLKCYLEKDYQNLYTVDLLCHGVTNQLYLDSEIKHLAHGKNITNVTFRGYNPKEDHHLCLWRNNNIIVNHRGDLDWYLRAFYKNISLRESCFSCTYSTETRVGDLSLGDFMGLDLEKLSEFKNNCVALIMINSEKGDTLVNYIKDRIIIKERTLEEAVKGGKSLQGSATKHPRRDVFRKYVMNMDFSRAIRHSIWKEMILAYIDTIVKHLHRKDKSCK